MLRLKRAIATHVVPILTCVLILTCVASNISASPHGAAFPRDAASPHGAATPQRQFNSLARVPALGFRARHLVTRPSDTHAPQPRSGTPTTFRLKNGLRVILKSDVSQPFVAVRMTYLSGSASDPARRPGLAHLTEHMAFSRTRHASQDLMLEVQSMGALELNGETSLDTTLYYETVPSSRLEQALWVESERLAFLLEKMTPTLLNKEQRIVEREIAMRRGPSLFFETQRRRWLFPPTHPYHTTKIDDQDPHASSLADVQAYFQGTHRADNAILSVVGDIDERVARAMVEKYFSSIVNPRSQLIRASLPDVQAPSKLRRVVGVWGSKPMVGLDWILPRIRDIKTYTMLQLLQWHLDDVMEYRLIEENRIANHLFTGISSGAGPAVLRVTITSPTKTDARLVETRAVAAAREAMNGYERALGSKRKLELALREANTDLQWQAREYTSQLADYGRLTTLEERLQILKTLTPNDLKTLVSRHLTPKQLRRLLFLPGGDSREGNIIE